MSSSSHRIPPLAAIILYRRPRGGFRMESRRSGRQDCLADVIGQSDAALVLHKLCYAEDSCQQMRGQKIGGIVRQLGAETRTYSA